MRFFITSILLLALIYAAAGSPCGTSTWMLPANSSSNSNSTTGASFCVQLNPNITLQYALVGSDQVLFHVDASLPPNTAYFGLGLSELGSMKGADMAIFHHSNSNSQASAVSSQPQEGSTTNSIAGWHLVDSYAPGFVTPVADSQQDVKLLDLSYSASNNTLSATWQRPLVPCVVNGGGGGGDQAASEEDLPLAVGMPVHVIWAHGRSWAYHGRNRGGKLIKFALEDGASSTGGDNSSSTAALNGTTSSMDAATGSSNGNESDIRVLDLVFPADTPPQETTYWVQYIKLPDDRCAGCFKRLWSFHLRALCHIQWHKQHAHATTCASVRHTFAACSGDALSLSATCLLNCQPAPRCMLISITSIGDQGVQGESDCIFSVCRQSLEDKPCVSALLVAGSTTSSSTSPSCAPPCCTMAWPTLA